MRILRVAQKVYPDVTGGGPYHVHAMSRDQAAMGHDVTVLTVGGGGGEEERDGYRVVRRPATVSALGNDISVGVARYLHRYADEYDVLHAHSHLYFSTNLAAVARLLGGPPLAITNHGLYSQTAPERVFDAYLRTAGRWTFDRGDVVFCYTEEDRERLRGFGVSTPIEVISNGIDTSRFTPEGDPSERVPGGGPVVLFVGRLVEGKRPGGAVAALDRLRETHPDARLVVCGEGPLREELDAAVAERDLEDAVTFLGHVSYDEMPAVYRAVDALVLPSRAEGLPRTVLEALASGVPAVVSDLEQVAPVVEGVGRAVPVGDIEGFAAALRAVLAGTDREPRTAVVDDHDWASTVERTTAALEHIADRNG
ncbi:glycosyltransferase family 4 protein [Haloglomus halophilum]|uniref:glycosyltransferase family 4 protein n=1 Tax=Haloglomus halophilum TaxID=2962672 RepID=UPI0020C95261|nr:glycosyltransferase family 4 protein [Haloglomus halophilum]